MQLLLATHNLHKIIEFKAILKHELVDVDIITLREFPHYLPQEESGGTFVANSELKAVSAAKALGYYTLADDSGLVIPALDGEPGIKSRRYSGEDASDEDNRKKLIKKLKEIDEEKRFGYYECALCLASPEGIIKTVIGKCEGSLILEPKGSFGFGYDSLFIKYDYNKTMAELKEEVKNRISHRRRAIDKLIEVLRGILSPITS